MAQESGVVPAKVVLDVIDSITELSGTEKDALRQLVSSNSKLLSVVRNPDTTSSQRIDALIRLARGAMSISDQSVPMTTEPTTSAAETSLTNALHQMEDSKAPLQRSSLRALVQIVQGLKSDPSKPKNRRVNMHNHVVVKLLAPVAGAKDVLRALGYVENESKGLMEIDESKVDLPLLTIALDLMTDRIAKLDGPSASSSASASAPSSSGSPKPASSAVRTVCKGNCGFYGDPNTEGYCSVCFKTRQSLKPCPKNCGNTGDEKFNGLCSVCFLKVKAASVGWHKRIHMAKLKLRAVRFFRLGTKAVQKNRQRCFVCSRKLGINGFECRCGYVFCGDHRFADKHECTFDYQKAHKKKLEDENQRIFGKKLKRLDSETDST